MSSQHNSFSSNKINQNSYKSGYRGTNQHPGTSNYRHVTSNPRGNPKPHASTSLRVSPRMLRLDKRVKIKVARKEPDFFKKQKQRTYKLRPDSRLSTEDDGTFGDEDMDEGLGRKPILREQRSLGNMYSKSPHQLQNMNSVKQRFSNTRVGVGARSNPRSGNPTLGATHGSFRVGMELCMQNITMAQGASQTPKGIGMPGKKGAIGGGADRLNKAWGVSGTNISKRVKLSQSPAAYQQSNYINTPEIPTEEHVKTSFVDTNNGPTQLNKISFCGNSISELHDQNHPESHNPHDHPDPPQSHTSSLMIKSKSTNHMSKLPPTGLHMIIHGQERLQTSDFGGNFGESSHKKNANHFQNLLGITHEHERSRYGKVIESTQTDEIVDDIMRNIDKVTEKSFKSYHTKQLDESSSRPQLDQEEVKIVGGGFEAPDEQYRTQQVVQAVSLGPRGPRAQKMRCGSGTRPEEEVQNKPQKSKSKETQRIVPPPAPALLGPRRGPKICKGGKFGSAVSQTEVETSNTAQDPIYRTFQDDNRKDPEIEIKMSVLELQENCIDQLNQSKLCTNNGDRASSKYSIEEKRYRKGEDYIIDLRGPSADSKRGLHNLPSLKPDYKPSENISISSFASHRTHLGAPNQPASSVHEPTHSSEALDSERRNEKYKIPDDIQFTDHDSDLKEVNQSKIDLNISTSTCERTIAESKLKGSDLHLDLSGFHRQSPTSANTSKQALSMNYPVSPKPNTSPFKSNPHQHTKKDLSSKIGEMSEEMRDNYIHINSKFNIQKEIQFEPKPEHEPSYSRQITGRKVIQDTRIGTKEDVSHKLKKVPTTTSFRTHRQQSPNAKVQFFKKLGKELHGKGKDEYQSPRGKIKSFQVGAGSKSKPKTQRVSPNSGGYKYPVRELTILKQMEGNQENQAQISRKKCGSPAQSPRFLQSTSSKKQLFKVGKTTGSVSPNERKPVSPRIVSSASNKIITDKLMNEFKNTIHTLNLNDPLTQINFRTFMSVLTHMNIVGGHLTSLPFTLKLTLIQAWRACSEADSEYAHLETVKVFVMAVLGVRGKWMYEPITLKPFRKRRGMNLTQGLTQKQGKMGCDDDTAILLRADSEVDLHQPELVDELFQAYLERTSSGDGQLGVPRQQSRPNSRQTSSRCSSKSGASSKRSSKGSLDHLHYLKSHHDASKLQQKFQLLYKSRVENLDKLKKLKFEAKKQRLIEEEQGRKVFISSKSRKILQDKKVVDKIEKQEINVDEIILKKRHEYEEKRRLDFAAAGIDIGSITGSVPGSKVTTPMERSLSGLQDSELALRQDISIQFDRFCDEKISRIVGHPSTANNSMLMDLFDQTTPESSLKSTLKSKVEPIIPPTIPQGEAHKHNDSLLRLLEHNRPSLNCSTITHNQTMNTSKAASRYLDAEGVLESEMSEINESLNLRDDVEEKEKIDVEEGEEVGETGEVGEVVEEGKPRLSKVTCSTSHFGFCSDRTSPKCVGNEVLRQKQGGKWVSSGPGVTQSTKPSPRLYEISQASQFTEISPMSYQNQYEITTGSQDPQYPHHARPETQAIQSHHPHQKQSTYTLLGSQHPHIIPEARTERHLQLNPKQAQDQISKMLEFNDSTLGTKATYNHHQAYHKSYKTETMAKSTIEEIQPTIPCEQEYEGLPYQQVNLLLDSQETDNSPGQLPSVPEEEPKMCLNVNLGKGLGEAKLQIYEGQNVEEVIAKFQRQYGKCEGGADRFIQGSQTRKRGNLGRQL